jgi:hypothetical protein
MSTRGRAALYLLSTALGLIIGFIGLRATGSEAWFLAVPGSVALGWLFLADPTRCQSNSKHPSPADDKDSVA